MSRWLRYGLAAALTTLAIPASAASAAAVAHGTAARPLAVRGGTLLGWGANRSGDLGDGTSASSDVPVPVTIPAGTRIVQARAGFDHSLALTSAGQVLAWGGNAHGQLGDGGTAGSNVPVPVRLPAGVRVTQVRAGCSGSLALTSGGEVLAWGANQFGQLGDGTRTDSTVPVRVRVPRGIRVRTIASGCFDNLILTTAGRVLAWGRDYEGSLGNGRMNASSRKPVPVRLPASARITATCSGGSFGLALASTGLVYGWGYNGAGQLGNGGTKNTDVPAAVHLPARSKTGKVTAISCGNDVGLALTSRGVVIGWGLDDFGQLGERGDGSFDYSPVVIPLAASIKVTSIVEAVDATFARTSAGRLLAWGYNAKGQLGNGKTVNSASPVVVQLPHGTMALQIGTGPDAFHSFAIIRPR